MATPVEELALIPTQQLKTPDDKRAEPKVEIRD